jgi:hypothetical protein
MALDPIFALVCLAAIVAAVPSIGYRTVRGEWLDLQRSRRAWWAVNGGAGVGIACVIAFLAVAYSGG